MKRQLQFLDSVLYRFERKIAGYIFLSMSFVVFIDVIHRVFSRSPGRISILLAGIFSVPVETIENKVSPLLMIGTTFIVSLLAIKARNKAVKKESSKRVIFLKSLFTTFILTLVVQKFIKVVPQGVMWAPYFGLICLLWIGFLGASMATHTNQHLMLEMGEKLWPISFVPYIRKLAYIAVTLFVCTIGTLATMSVLDHYADFHSGPGAGLIPSIDWPKWLVYMVIPYSFFMMGFRFLGLALGLLKHEVHQEIA